MARAAVTAKQQAAKAQAKATRPRGKRKHSGGGNPNQELFFVRLRRHQKWVYAVLAVVFAFSFVLVGVGSGTGGGLNQLFNGIFSGGGGSSISKAQDLVKKDPAAGYRQLAQAYETNGDNAQAMTALQHYLKIKKTDAATWAELGGLALSQGTQYSTQYSAAAQNAQTVDPSAAFQPAGTLGTAIGPNTTYQQAAQNASTKATKLYTKATTTLGRAVKDYQQASKLKPNNSSYLQELANAAANSGNSTVAVAALHRYLKLNPNSPLAPQIRKEIASLSPSTPSVKTGGK
jgi:tetratricopeptide (TPR) repeat protein